MISGTIFSLAGESDENETGEFEQDPKPKLYSLIRIKASRRLTQLSATIKRVSQTQAAVMLRGADVGTEKDHIALMIHRDSSRAANPFIKFTFAAG